MEKIQKSPLGAPIIKDPAEYLEQPCEGLGVRGLFSGPSRELLMTLPFVEKGVGLSKIDSQWYLAKGSSDVVPAFFLPAYADVLIISHTAKDEINKEAEAVPDLCDFFNCSHSAKNLIVSSFGITQYWPVKASDKRRRLEAELFSSRPSRFYDRNNHKEYLEFLEENDAKFVVHPWEEIDDLMLDTLIHR